MIKFEKVSKQEFFKSVVEDDEKYENLSLPKRNSKGSVGYDFFSPVSMLIKSHDKALVPTGIRAKIPENIVLQIYVRSSMAFKKGTKLANQVGIIDSDYYDQKNEGHIYIGLENTSDQDLLIHEGDKIAQGIFVPCYFVTDEETLGERNGWSYMKEKEER